MSSIQNTSQQQQQQMNDGHGQQRQQLLHVTFIPKKI